MKKLFITGTDTGIGKTVISALIAKFLKDQGCKVHYLKPIQTGDELDHETVHKLSKISSSNFIKLKKPLSPHEAAFKENKYIDFKSIINHINHIKNYDYLLIEGAGGLYVPINNNYFMIDLIKNLDCKAVLVARTSLGTLNHTLLSFNKLRSINKTPIAIFMVGEKNPWNINTIKTITKCEVVYVPWFTKKFII